MGFSGGQGNCTTWSGCDGKYGTDLETMRQAGEKKSPPENRIHKSRG